MTFLLSEELRHEQAKYREDLLRRVQSVACPVCGATAGVPCRSAAGNFWANSCHSARHEQAKREGTVAGSMRRYGPKARWPAR